LVETPFSLPINGSKERGEENWTAWHSAVPLYYYWDGLDCCKSYPVSVIDCQVTSSAVFSPISIAVNM
jgi:hypothetical protein